LFAIQIYYTFQEQANYIDFSSRTEFQMIGATTTQEARETMNVTRLNSVHQDPNLERPRGQPTATTTSLLPANYPKFLDFPNPRSFSRAQAGFTRPSEYPPPRLPQHLILSRPSSTLIRLLSSLFRRHIKFRRRPPRQQTSDQRPERAGRFSIEESREAHGARANDGDVDLEYTTPRSLSQLS
jgi:hypothetical protein